MTIGGNHHTPKLFKKFLQWKDDHQPLHHYNVFCPIRTVSVFRKNGVVSEKVSHSQQMFNYRQVIDVEISLYFLRVLRLRAQTLLQCVHFSRLYCTCNAIDISARPTEGWIRTVCLSMHSCSLLNAEAARVMHQYLAHNRFFGNSHCQCGNKRHDTFLLLVFESVVSLVPESKVQSQKDANPREQGFNTYLVRRSVAFLPAVMKSSPVIDAIIVANLVRYSTKL